MREARMRVVAMAIVLSTLLIAACALPALAKDNEREVHLIGMSRGFEETDEATKAPHAYVYVHRPGKQVSLVLASSISVTWHVITSNGTELSEVILGEKKLQTVEGVSKSTKITKAPLEYTAQPPSQNFHMLVRQIFKITQQELSSFQAVYSSRSEGPMFIDKVQDDPRLAVNYPEPPPLEELPPEVRDASFVAHHYLGRIVTTSVGECTLAGPIDESLRPLPRDVKRIAHDPVSKLCLGIGFEVFEVDWDTKTKLTALDPGLDLPRLAWSRDITYDTKRHRFILAGERYLFTFSSESRTWSAICRRPIGLNSFVYSTAEDCLYGVLCDAFKDNVVPALVKMNDEGEIVEQFRLGPPILPGSLNNFYFTDTPTQVVLVGKYVAIIVSPDYQGSRSKIDAASIYLVDPKTRQVWLTAKKMVDE